MRRQLGTLIVAFTVGLSATTALATSRDAAHDTGGAADAVASTSSVLGHAATTAHGALLRAITRHTIMTSTPQRNSVASIVGAVAFRTVELNALPVSARSLAHQWNHLVISGEVARAERAAVRNAPAITQFLRSSVAARSIGTTAGVDANPVYCVDGTSLWIAFTEFVLIYDTFVLVPYCVHWYPGDPSCFAWAIRADEAIVVFGLEWSINCLILP